MSDSLADPLRVAVAAAREAGALIRQEFHRPGGPRGHGSHADIDAEVETVIRRTLLEAYPDWAYLGEETGPGGRPTPSTDGWWIPTTAPSPSCAGSAAPPFRSPSSATTSRCSAWSTPAGARRRGDLIAWARGGPLTRNGRDARTPRPGALLGRGRRVLVSQEAGRSPAANAECTAPARFRTMPSIAYRLALVAAGEGARRSRSTGPGTGTLPPATPCSCAAGGELVDENGRAIRYRLGHAESGPAIGGALDGGAGAGPAAVGRGPLRRGPRPADPASAPPGRLPHRRPAVLSRAQGRCWASSPGTRWAAR